MAKLDIMGRSFEIAPYKLGALRKAAPHIDAINNTAGALTTVAGMVESQQHTLAVLLIGLQKIDPSITAEMLDEEVGIEDIPALIEAFRQIMQESGLSPKGEAPAPVALEAAGA